MAEETKNLCAQIPASLHAQVREQQEMSGMTWLLTEFYAYEKGGKGRMADNKRTVAFQVPAELFDQLKAYLTRHNMTQNAFFLSCIQQALADEET